MSVKTRSGTPGEGLYVSEDSGYTPGPFVWFKPSAAEKKRFARFLGSMEGSWVNQKPLGKTVPWADRTIFFEFDAPKDPSAEGRVDGAGHRIVRPKRWAVVGGPMLTVAYLGEKGQWKAASVNAPLGLADSYVLNAVFDMNGDGVPEIVVAVGDGATFVHRVLSLNAKTMSWEVVVESP